MQSWRWSDPARFQMWNVFVVVMPATLVFAFVYFWFCERPFLVRRGESEAAPEPQTASVRFKLTEEGFPSRAFLTTVRSRLNAYLRRGSNTTDPGAEPATGAVGPTSRLANTYADSIAVADGQN